METPFGDVVAPHQGMCWREARMILGIRADDECGFDSCRQSAFLREPALRKIKRLMYVQAAGFKALPRK